MYVHARARARDDPPEQSMRVGRSSRARAAHACFDRSLSFTPSIESFHLGHLNILIHARIPYWYRTVLEFRTVHVRYDTGISCNCEPFRKLWEPFGFG